jgi:hypothetical protein
MFTELIKDKDQHSQIFSLCRLLLEKTILGYIWKLNLMMQKKEG